MSKRKSDPGRAEAQERELSLDLMNAGYAAVESLAPADDAANPRKAGVAFEIAPREFATRKRFARFTAEDAALLRELRPLLERHADELVERFYDNLTRNDALSPLLADAATVEGLKRLQREYLLSLAGGTYDVSYAANRLRIGRIHNRIGVAPEWYLGAYGLYLDLLLPLVHESWAAQPRRAVRAGTALTKLMILDMQLVLDAYYGLRERQAVARSEQLAAVGELAASIAHEVRNPLAGMKGALEVLRKELAVKPSNQEVIEELLVQIVRLENLVRDLLNFARPRALDPRRFDLHELLDRLLRTYKKQSDAAGILVQRSYGPDTSELWADPTQMEQVFLNLIHNGLQAMDKGGAFHITTRAVEGAVEIAFGDSGKGIPPADLERVFQPFFTTKHRGSGLGLPIVLKIAEAHGGKVSIRTGLGRGTTVTVTVPN